MGKENVVLLSPQALLNLVHVVSTVGNLVRGSAGLISNKVHLDMSLVVDGRRETCRKGGQGTVVAGTVNGWLDQTKKAKRGANSTGIVFGKGYQLAVENDRRKVCLRGHVQLSFPLRRWTFGAGANTSVRVGVDGATFGCCRHGSVVALKVRLRLYSWHMVSRWSKVVRRWE